MTALLLSLLVADPAAVDPVPADPVVIELKIIPAGHDLVVPKVGRVRYFLLDEYLRLAEADAELFKLKGDVMSLQEMQSGLKSQIAELETVKTSLESDIDTLRTRAERLEAHWNQCEANLVEARTPPIWPYVVGAGGVVVGLVGFGMWLGSH